MVGMYFEDIWFEVGNITYAHVDLHINLVTFELKKSLFYC